MPHLPHVLGCIRIQPSLNETERDHLLDLLDAAGTLRGTVTGRGDRGVPFARLGWVVCADGCCLSWDPDLENARWMAHTLRFVVDHLLRSQAKAQGHPRFAAFTFDHVATGAAMARADDGTLVLVVAERNEVSARTISAPCDSAPCDSAPCDSPLRTSASGHATRMPENVIVFRPRGA